MKLKKFLKGLLFPPSALVALLLPISAALLIYALIFFEAASPTAIASYALSFYTLTVCCVRIPGLITRLSAFKRENRYARRWFEDTRLRLNVSLYGALLFNSAYAIMHLGMGIRHKSFWFFSLAGYYILLSLIRFFLLRHTWRHEGGERLMEELIKYRACGAALLIINLALALIIFFMVYWNRTFIHHEITTIAMAAYTFTSLALAIKNAVKYRKHKSPVFSAAKTIGLVSACVSMLTLEAAMLTAFGGETLSVSARRIFLAASGGAVSVFIIATAIYMIILGTKNIRLLKAAGEQQNG